MFFLLVLKFASYRLGIVSIRSVAVTIAVNDLIRGSWFENNIVMNENI